MGKITRYLNQLIVGNVFDTPDILEAYSTDRSVLKIKPKYVALPESTEDIRRLMRFCYQLATKDMKVPITVRGAGSDEMGADLGSGLVISMEKLNKLLESDRRERLVRVQAGITLKELNTALSMHGLTVPIGGHQNETIGGLISNCPTDSYAGKYGGIMNYVEKIEVVLQNGDVLQTSRISKSSLTRKMHEKTMEGGIYSKVAKVAEANKDLIENIRKNGVGSAGYPTIAQAVRNKSIDLMPLFFGAEGTLGIISEVILRAVPIKSQTKRVVATFEDITMAQKFLDLVNDWKPRELNIYDLNIVTSAKEAGKRLSAVTSKLENGFVVYACFDDKANSALKKIEGLRSALPKSTQLIVESRKNEITLNEFKNVLESFLNQTKDGERVPVLTNFYLPARNLANFIEDMKVIEQKMNLELDLYGSYSSSTYSLRPKFNPEDEDFNKKIITFLRTGAFIVNRQGGALTGGAPEGRLKAAALDGELGKGEEQMYLEIKGIFDRYDILNPGVKLDVDLRYILRHFRTTSSAKIVI